jgi:hypothetical protein
MRGLRARAPTSSATCGGGVRETVRQLAEQFSNA